MSVKSFGQKYVENFRMGGGNMSPGERYIAQREKKKREELIASRIPEGTPGAGRLGSIGRPQIHSWDKNKSAYGMTPETIRKNAMGNASGNPAARAALSKSVEDAAGKRAFARAQGSGATGELGKEWSESYKKKVIKKRGKEWERKEEIRKMVAQDKTEPVRADSGVEMEKAGGGSAIQVKSGRKGPQPELNDFHTDTSSVVLSGIPGVGREAAKIHAEAEEARKKAASSYQRDALDYLERGAKGALAPARWQMHGKDGGGKQNAGQLFSGGLKLTPAGGEKEQPEFQLEGGWLSPDDNKKKFQPESELIGKFPDEKDEAFERYNEYVTQMRKKKWDLAEGMGLIPAQLDELYGDVGEFRFPSLPSYPEQGMSFKDYAEAAVAGEKPEYSTFTEYLGARKDFGDKSAENAGRFSDNVLEKVWNNKNWFSDVVEGGGYLAEAYATDEEREYYNYLVNTGQKDLAEWYYQNLKPELLGRASKDFTDSLEDKPVLEVLGRGAAGMANGSLGLVNAVRSMVSDEEIDPDIYDFISGELKENLDKEGLGWQVAGDVSESIGNMVPAIAASAAATMSGAPEAVPEIIGAATMGATTYGNTYKEERLNGKEADEARAYAALTGASEATLEYLLGGISKLGGKVSGHVIKRGIDSIDNVMGRVAAEIAGKMGSEFTEEYLQEVLDPVFRNICFDENNDFQLFSEEALYSGVLGALTAGVMEGPSVVHGAVRSVTEGKTINGTKVTDVLKRFGAGQDAKSVLFALSQEEKLTDGQVGLLFDAYKEVYPEAASGYLEAARQEKNLQKYEERTEKRLKRKFKKGRKDTAISGMEGVDTETKGMSEKTDGVLAGRFKATDSFKNGELSEAVAQNFKEEFNRTEYEKYMAKYFQSGKDGISKVQLGQMLHRDPRTRGFGIQAAQEAYTAGVGEWNRKHSEAQEKMVKSVTKSLGLDVEFYTEDDGRNAYRTEDGKIFINKTSENPFVVALGHELAHEMEVSCPETYTGLKDLVLERMKLFDEEGYQKRLRVLERLYEAEGVPKEDMEGEIVANAVSDFLFDEAVAEKIIAMDGNFAQKILAAIKGMIRKIRKELKGYQYDSFEAQALRSSLEDLNEAKEIYTKGLGEIRKIRKEEGSKESAESSSASRFSLNEKEQKAYDGSENAELYDFLNLVHETKREEHKKKREFEIKDGISERLRRDIEARVGFSIEGYSLYITEDEVAHIEKRHGANGSADHSMKDLHDLAKIKYVLENYEKMFLGTKTKGKRNGDGSRAQVLGLQKKLGDDFYYTMLMVPDNKRKRVNILTAYINKKDVFSEVIVPEGLNNPYVRNEAQINTSEKSVAQDKGNVKASLKKEETANANMGNSSQKSAYPDSNSAVSTVTITESLENVNDTTHKNNPSGNALEKLGLVRDKKDAVEGLKYSLKESNNGEVVTDIQNPDYYTYENLTALPDMQVGSIGEVLHGKVVPGETRADLVARAKENIAAYNEGRNDYGAKYLYNASLDNRVRITTDGLRHGLAKIKDKDVIADLALPSYFEHAIVVNETEGMRNDADRGYVLLGCFRDSDREVRIARIMVNSYDGELQLNENQIIYSIKGSKKIEAAWMVGNRASTGIMSENSTPSVASKISIKEFLDVVKEKFPHVLPKNVADKFGYERHEREIKGLRYSLKEGNSAYLEEEHIANSMEQIKEGIALTGGVMPTEPEIHKMAEEILERFKSSYDADRLAGDISTALTNMESGPVREIVDNLAAAVRPALMESALMDYTLRNQYQDMLSFFYGEGIALSEEEKTDWERSERSKFPVLRKKYAEGLLLKEDGTSLDSVWNELCTEYPEFFDSDVEGAERVLQVLDAIDAVQPRLKSEVGYNLNKTAVDRALCLLADYFELPEVKTAAGKAAGFALSGVSGTIRSEVNKYRADSGQRFNKSMKILRKRALRIGKTSAELSQQLREGIAIARTNERLRSRNVVERRKYQDGIRRNAKTLTNWMENPTAARHVPESLRGAVVEVLASVDYLSKRADPGSKESMNWTERMRKLQVELKNIVEVGDGGVGALGDMNPELPGMIEKLVKNYEGKQLKLSDMSTEELGQLNVIVNGIRKGVTEHNKLRANELSKHVDTLGEATISNLQKKKDGNAKGLKKFMDFDIMDPIRVFEHMGEQAKSIFGSFMTAFDKRTRLLEEAMEYTKPVLEGMDISRMEKEMQTMKLGDKEVRLSKAQLMSLYLYGKREASLHHLEKGGFRVDEVKGGKVDGKRCGKSVKQNEIYRIKESQISLLCDKYLSKQERQAADRLQFFLANQCAVWGNEISQALYEFDKYTEEAYFPMHTDGDFNKTNNRTVSEGSLNQVANYGFTKKLQREAKTPLRLLSIFDVFTQHVVEMANHNAYTLPVSDAMKWLNYSRAEEIKEITDGGSETGYAYDSVKHQLRRVYGETAERYIINLIKDINGESTNLGTDLGMDKLISNFKVASVAGNLRVVVQQPTAVIRVMDVVNPKYVLKARRTDGISGGKKARKYCGLAKWKSWGFFDTGLNTGMKGILTGQGSFKEKFQEKALAPAGKADDVTWGMIWNICEAEQKDLTGLSGEALYEKTARRMTEVCTKTQVVDSVLTKSAALRSKHQLVKAEMTFQSEPNKTLNMLLDHVYYLREGFKDRKQNPEWFKKCLKKLGRGAVVFLGNAVLNAAAQSLMDAGRDDDETKGWLEKYGDSIISNLADNINPLLLIPYVKDGFSIASGYGTDRNELAALNNLVTGAGRITKWLSDEEYKEKHSVYQTFYIFAQGLSQLFGIPASALIREIVTHVNLASRTFAGKNLIPTKTAGYTDKYTRIVEAMEKGDTETVYKLKTWLREHGRDEKTIERGIAYAKKKKEGN